MVVLDPLWGETSLDKLDLILEKLDMLDAIIGKLHELEEGQRELVAGQHELSEIASLMWMQQEQSEARLQGRIESQADRVWRKSEFIVDLLGYKLDTLMYKADIPVYYLRNIQSHLQLKDHSTSMGPDN